MVRFIDYSHHTLKYVGELNIKKYDTTKDCFTFTYIVKKPDTLYSFIPVQY